MANFIVILVIVLVVGAAMAYIIKAKKSGQKCIGCPHSSTCGKTKTHGCSGSCSSCGSCKDKYTNK